MNITEIAAEVAAALQAGTWQRSTEVLAALAERLAVEEAAQDAHWVAAEAAMRAAFAEAQGLESFLI